MTIKNYFHDAVYFAGGMAFGSSSLLILAAAAGSGIAAAQADPLIALAAGGAAALGVTGLVQGVKTGEAAMDTGRDTPFLLGSLVGAVTCIGALSAGASLHFTDASHTSGQMLGAAPIERAGAPSRPLLPTGYKLNI